MIHLMFNWEKQTITSLELAASKYIFDISGTVMYILNLPVTTDWLLHLLYSIWKKYLSPVQKKLLKQSLASLTKPLCLGALLVSFS